MYYSLIMNKSEERKLLSGNNTENLELPKEKNRRYSSALPLRCFNKFLSVLSSQHLKGFMAVVLFLIFVVLLNQLQSLRNDNIYLKKEVKILKAKSNKATSSNTSLALHHNQFEMKTLSKNLGIEHIKRMLDALDVQISNLSKIVLKSGKISTPSVNKENSTKTKINSIHSQNSMIRKWNTTRPNRLWRLCNGTEAKYEDMKKLIGKLNETVNIKIADGLNTLNTRVKNIEERCKSENTTRRNQLPSSRTEPVSKTGRDEQQTTRNGKNSIAKSIGTLTYQYNESLRLYSKCQAKMNEIEKRQSQLEKDSKNKLLDVRQLILSNKTLYQNAEKIEHTQQSLQTDLKTMSETQKSLQTDLKTMSETQKSLQTDLKTISETQKSLQTGLKTISETQNSLQTDLKTISETQKSLQTDLKTISETQNSLQTDLKTISETQNSLQTDLKTISETQNSLQTKSKVAFFTFVVLIAVDIVFLIFFIFLCCKK